MTTSLFDIYVVDAWLMYKEATTDSLQTDPKLSQQEFSTVLAERGLTRKCQSTSQQQKFQPTVFWSQSSFCTQHETQKKWFSNQT